MIRYAKRHCIPILLILGALLLILIVYLIFEKRLEALQQIPPPNP
jgi:hypothetical protein